MQLQRLGADLDARICVKLESRNPCGSIKDRVGVALIRAAEERGELEPGATLVEPTSGNMGIALAFAAAAKGYRLVLTMPERIAQERVALLEFLGAEVVLTSGSLMQGAVDKARELQASIPGACMLQQFNNPANPEVHRRTTAEEIWADSEGQVDVLVAGVGTGGTITGVGEVLKSRKKSVQVVAVEPSNAAVLSGGKVGQHYVSGLGAGFVPEVLNKEIIDRVVPVSEATAIEMQIRLAQEEGISAGISSGAALGAALHLAKESRGEMFVVILPDLGERYVATQLYQSLKSGLAR